MQHTCSKGVAVRREDRRKIQESVVQRVEEPVCLPVSVCERERERESQERAGSGCVCVCVRVCGGGGREREEREIEREERRKRENKVGPIRRFTDWVLESIV